MNQQSTGAISANSSSTPISEQQMLSRYHELRSRRGLAASEIDERRELRAWVASHHRFDEPDVADDLEADPPAATTFQAFAWFVNAPGALKITGRELAGAELLRWHRRLFTKGPSRRPAPARPNARTQTRTRERRDGSRRHSTRGGTDPASGESSPSDLPAPQTHERTCAICGVNIAHRRGDAQTCENAAHKKQWQRERKRHTLNDQRPDHTACIECGRRWLSDLNPADHRCPCGGTLRIGSPDSQPKQNPRPSWDKFDPFDGIGHLGELGSLRDLLDCVRNFSPTPYRHWEAPPWRVARPQATLNQRPAISGGPYIAEIQAPVDLNRFRMIHRRFASDLAFDASERLEVAA